MPNVTVEGAELIFEIGEKVKQDFDDKKLPLMIAMINAILIKNSILNGIILINSKMKKLVTTIFILFLVFSN